MNDEEILALLESADKLLTEPRAGEMMAKIDRRFKLAEYAMLRAQLLILRAQYEQVLYPPRTVDGGS